MYDFSLHTVTILKGMFEANGVPNYFELYQGNYYGVDVFGGAVSDMEIGPLPYTVLSQAQYAEFMAFNATFGFANVDGANDAAAWVKANIGFTNLTTNRVWTQNYTGWGSYWHGGFPILNTIHGPEFAVLVSPDRTNVYEVFLNTCDELSVDGCGGNWWTVPHNKYIVSFRPQGFSATIGDIPSEVAAHYATMVQNA
jgi:hypothetical protein